LPKRLELLFLIVLAFPNASRIGLQPKILSSIPTSFSYFSTEPMEVRTFMQYFAFSVFPAPLSPEITID
jgi:hypothetical protein